MSAPVLRARGRPLRLGDRPLVMGILNATPDSFSDGGAASTHGARLERARQLVAEGADILDVGGESNVTNRPAVTVDEEIERVVPLVDGIARELDVVISVDTYKPPVARAAIAAGAHMVNDISGLADPDLAAVVAAAGAALVLMHTPVPPKTQSLDDARFGPEPAAEVAAALRRLLEVAGERGVGHEQTVLDPGPDFGKTPRQTVEILRGLPQLQALGRPILLALSRKDFIGAIVQRRPRERDAGTLAAIAHGLDAGGHILRVHDVAATTDFLAVRDVLAGRRDLDRSARVPEHLRREPQGP